MRKSTKIAAAISVAALVGIGGVAALADTRNNADNFYFCIGTGNVVTHAYPLDGWHGNHCETGESRYEVQGVPAPATPPPTDPPTTTPPPTTDPPVTTPPPTTDPPVTTPPPTTPPPTTDPPTTGWPNASNTGVQPGVTLTAYTGTKYITVAGTTIENKIINGNVTIKASNVTLKNVKVFGRIQVDDYNPDVSGVLLSHVEIDGTGKAAGNGINDYSVGGPYGGGFTLEYANIHGWETGVTINSDFDKTIVRESYIHDLGPASSDHKAGLSANSAGNADIIHNNIDCEVGGCSGSMVLYGDFGPIKDWNVQNNLFNTEGSYCTYTGSISGKKYPTATGITWKNNVYGREHNSQCGQYGPTYGWSAGGGTNVWSGNKWADTGATINP